MKSKIKSAETAQKLLEVGRDLFSSSSFRGTSIRDIAKATGMTISNIYYYFGSKDGLLLAILEHTTRDVVKSLREVSERDMEPLERFKLLVRTHLNLAKTYKREMKIFFLDEEHLTPEGNKVNKQIQVDVLNIYRKQLEQLRETGYVRYQSLTVLTFNILGVINWQLRWYRPEGPLSVEDLTEEVMDFIMLGVLGGPSNSRVYTTPASEHSAS